MERILRFKGAVEATISLFRIKDISKNPAVHETAKANCRIDLEGPQNYKAYLADEFSNVLAKHEAKVSNRPYWNTELKYDPVEIYTGCVQLFDCYNGPIPTCVIAPEKDVQAFIGQVLASDHKLTTAEQFDILLTITGGNLVGAANVGCMGSRIMARAWDSRVYRETPMDADLVREAREHLAPFETYNNRATDAPGDTYYFWTSFFAAAAFNTLNGVEARALDNLFNYGPDIMKFVRKTIVHQPTVNTGNEAPTLGRQLSKAMVEMAR